MTRIGVIGAGAWGTALAQVYAVAGNDVVIAAREQDIVDCINNDHDNCKYLPDIRLADNLRATVDMRAAAESDIVLIVTPAQHVRATLKNIAANLGDRKPLVLCAKGIELNSGKMMSQVAAEEAPDAELAILTGPNFAGEIVRGLPSASTVAARTQAAADAICALLNSRNLRPYASDDIIGAEIGGAVKNVIAIASGMVHGMGLGESAGAALVTRGLAEIARLAERMGGRRETLMGMCGMGDMMLTCSSMQSRNFSLGALMGQGQSLENILAARNGVTEGVHTARAVMVMAKHHNVDMPISNMVDQCLNHGLSLGDGVRQIMERPLKAEKH
ncbi:MAG: Glycerol-3-phosphate dehydrogenase [Micavibrio sp.]|nr:Glycerol-3-phosphate dehydrogenase [Micavibrio sp.]